MLLQFHSSSIATGNSKQQPSPKFTSPSPFFAVLFLPLSQPAFSRMSASAQAFANFSATIVQSRTISKFQSFPRWPGASSNFEFNTDYLAENALTALIPIFAGLLLTILTLIHIIIRHTCRSVSTNARSQKISNHSSLSRLQILLSATILTAIAVFLSLGLLGNAVLTFSVDDAVDVIQSVVDDLSRLGFAFLDTAILMRKRIESFNVSDAKLPESLQTSIGDQITPTFRTLRGFALKTFPEVGPLRTQLNILIAEIGEVLDVVSKITDIIYGVTLAIILLLATAPLFLFLSDALGRKKKRGRRWPHFVFLIPLLLAWILVGVVQSAGIVVSDVCGSLHDYREVLMGRPALSNENAFVDSGFTCPQAEVASDIQKRINDTAVGVTQSELAAGTIQLLLQESAQRVSSAATWSGEQAARLVNCSTQIEFSGKLEFIVCGTEGASAMEGLYDLFIAFLGLALCLHVALFLGLFGVGVARYLFVWKMPALEVSDDGFETPSEGKGYDVMA